MLSRAPIADAPTSRTEVEISLDEIESLFDECLGRLLHGAIHADGETDGSAVEADEVGVAKVERDQQADGFSIPIPMAHHRSVAGGQALGLLRLLRVLATRHGSLRSRVTLTQVRALIEHVVLPTQCALPATTSSSVSTAASIPAASTSTTTSIVTAYGATTRVAPQPATPPAVVAAAYELLLALCEGGGGLAGVSLRALWPVHAAVGGGAAAKWADYFGLCAAPSVVSAGYVGLTNLGCTCYMAACMQQLFMLPGLAAGVMHAKPEQVASDAEMLVQLQLLFAHLGAHLGYLLTYLLP